MNQPNFKTILNNNELNNFNNKKDIKSNAIVISYNFLFKALFLFLLILFSFFVYNNYFTATIFYTKSEENIEIYLETEKDTIFIGDISKVNIIMKNPNNIKWNTVDLTISYNIDDIDIVDENGHKINKIYNNLDLDLINKVVNTENQGLIILQAQSKQDVIKDYINIGYFYIKGKQKKDVNLSLDSANIYISMQEKINTNINKKGDLIRVKDDLIFKNDKKNYLNNEENTNQIEYLETEKLITKNIWIVDIKGHWAYDFILKVKPYEVLYGDFISSDMARLYPDKNITIMKFLIIAFKLFDVQLIDGDVYKTAFSLGLIDDDNLDNFITKVHALKILYKLTPHIYFDKKLFLSYPDVDHNSWYSIYVSWAIDRKLHKILAYKSMYFKPYETITKAQAIAMIATLKKL